MQISVGDSSYETLSLGTGLKNLGLNTRLKYSTRHHTFNHPFWAFYNTACVCLFPIPWFFLTTDFCRFHKRISLQFILNSEKRLMCAACGLDLGGVGNRHVWISTGGSLPWTMINQVTIWECGGIMKGKVGKANSKLAVKIKGLKFAVSNKF